MIDCQIITSLIFITCALLGWYAVSVRSASSLIDVERWSNKDAYESSFTMKWYLVRLCSVILVIGGMIHLQSIAKRIYSKFTAR